MQIHIIILNQHFRTFTQVSNSKIDTCTREGKKLAIYDKLMLQKSLTKEQWNTLFRRRALHGFRVRLQERKADLAHLIMLN